MGATQDISIKANQLSGKGKVLAGGNITVNLQQDYVQNTGLMQADGNLSLSSKGAIFTQTNILAGKKLAIKANALSNESVIKGEDTELDIANTLTNTGLIDGDDTLIKADVLTNKGRGRIFGDHLAIQAGKLNNLAETVNDTPRAATIAARDRLDLGVSEALVNQAKSQIFSLGGLRIGRSLDAQHAAIGQGDSLVNNNATIEAYGDMHINMAAIQNLNAGLKTETVVTSTENYDQFTPKDQSSLYDTQDYPIWQIGNEGISWRYGSNYNLPFNFREYWRYIYSGTTHETRVKTSLPGEIIAGQHLNLTGNVINSDSRIIAGGKLAHSGGTLNNKNTTGNTTTSYSGTSYYYDYDGGGKGFSYDVSINPYNPAPSVTTQPLATTQYLAQTTSSKNGTVASLSPNSLGSQRPDESLLNTLTSLYRQTAPGAGYNLLCLEVGAYRNKTKTEGLDDYLCYCIQSEQYQAGITEYEKYYGVKKISLKKTLSPRAYGYAFCLNEINPQYTADDLLEAGRKMLQANLEDHPWLGYGNYYCAAMWLKNVYWHHNRTLTPLETILKAYENMPGVPRPSFV